MGVFHGYSSNDQRTCTFQRHGWCCLSRYIKREVLVPFLTTTPCQVKQVANANVPRGLIHIQAMNKRPEKKKKKTLCSLQPPATTPCYHKATPVCAVCADPKRPEGKQDDSWIKQKPSTPRRMIIIPAGSRERIRTEEVKIARRWGRMASGTSSGRQHSSS